MKTTVKKRLETALKLFAIFFKIGLFSFGGGYAMFAMIEREVVEKYRFLTRNELMDVFSIAESTPGAVAINTATFVGTKMAGIVGGALATLGVVLPSFLIIFGLSYVIDLLKDNVWVQYAFRGIRIGVLVLISKAVISFYRNMRKDWYDFIFLIAAFLIASLTDLSVIYIILATIGISIIALVIKNVREKKLGIIKDFDAYQKRILDEASNTDKLAVVDNEQNRNEIEDGVTATSTLNGDPIIAESEEDEK